MIIGRKNPYRELEKRMGYSFRRRSLLEMALVHRSYRFENERRMADNQRLEFLGDAMLGFITAEYLFHEFSDMDEGYLTALRSRATSGKALTKLARDIGLGAYMKIGKGEEKTGGRTRASNLEDALESVIGAAYLDGGMKAIQKIFRSLFAAGMADLSRNMWAGNPKGELQEYAQRVWKKSPQYRIVAKDGPPHAAIFTCEASVSDKRKGTGKGRNKQEAEAEAARDLLQKLSGRSEADSADRNTARWTQHVFEI